METQREALAARGVDHDKYDVFLEQNRTIDDETTAIKVVRKSDGKSIEAVISKSRRQMAEENDTTYIDTIVELVQELEGLKFEYSAAPQRTPEWYKARLGKPSASNLYRWLAVSKAKGKIGTPLQARLDYEKELMFERQFGVSFQTYVNSAMQEGIDYEQFAAHEYAKLHPEWVLEEVGCFFNKFFVASPDRLIFPKGSNTADVENAIGEIEVKIVKDNTFTEILISGVPDKHYKQIQGQLWATGLPWCDYVALNFNTKQFVVIRVERDEEMIDYLKLSVQEKLVVAEFATTNLHAIQEAIPEGVELGANIDRSDSNIGNGGW